MPLFYSLFFSFLARPPRLFRPRFIFFFLFLFPSIYSHPCTSQAFRHPSLLASASTARPPAPPLFISTPAYPPRPTTRDALDPSDAHSPADPHIRSLDPPHTHAPPSAHTFSLASPPRIASPPRTTASAHSHIYPHASCIVSGRIIVLDYSRDCRLDHVVPTRTAIYPPPTLYRYAVDNRPVLETPSVLFFSLPVPPTSVHRPSYIRTT